MNVSTRGLDLVKKYEGFYSKPYLDPVGIPTIGYGVIKYPNGKRVTMSDRAVSEKEASGLLMDLLAQTYVPELRKHLKSKVNQNQFDALVSFIYNLGGSNLGRSTLLRKINVNPNDSTIRDEFMKWNKAGGRVFAGLTRRRQEESDLYFTPVVGGSGDDSLSKHTTSDLHLRTGAGTENTSITVLKKGTEVNVLNERAGWTEVFVCSTKTSGWVSSKYIK